MLIFIIYFTVDVLAVFWLPVVEVLAYVLFAGSIGYGPGKAECHGEEDIVHSKTTHLVVS